MRRTLTLLTALLLTLAFVPAGAQAQTPHHPNTSSTGTTAQAQPAAVNPSFQLVRGVPDTCSAAANDELRFDTLNNVTFGSGSNQATLNVDGVGVVATYAGNHDQAEAYPSIGDGFYDITVTDGYDVAAGTPVTVTITTYSGLNQTGAAAYQSTLTYSCDSGAVVSSSSSAQ